MHGDGTFTLPNGSRYKGEFKDGNVLFYLWYFRLRGMGSISGMMEIVTKENGRKIKWTGKVHINGRMEELILADKQIFNNLNYS